MVTVMFIGPRAERAGEHRQKRERTKVQATDDDRAFAAEFIADISKYDAAQHNTNQPRTED
jgi:hypothetical protein